MSINQWDELQRQNKALLQVYQDALAELKGRLEYQVKNNLSVYHTNALIGEIEEIIRKLNEYTYDWVNYNVPIAYEVGSNLAVEKLTQNYRMSGLDVSFGGVHRAAVEAIAKDTFESVAKATQLMAGEVKDAVQTVAKKKFSQGMVTGQSRRYITKDLMLELANRGWTYYTDDKNRHYIKLSEYIKEMAEDTFIGFVDKAGRKWDILNYCEMLTRTKIAESTSRGTENRLVANGLDLVIIPSHGAEDWCRFYENKVFSITGNTPGYPKLEDAPNGGTPFHPRCKHREAPFIEKFEDEATINYAKDLDPKYLGLNKKGGYADQAALRNLEFSHKLRHQENSDKINTEAYISAKSGGRHGGKYLDALTWTDKQLIKASHSYDKQVLIHIEKINNPKTSIENWDSMSDKEKTGVIKKWKKDALRNQELKEVIDGIIEERRNSDE